MKEYTIEGIARLRLLWAKSLQKENEKLEAELKRLREAIADVADNMEAADDSYMGGFIEDLRKVIE